MGPSIQMNNNTRNINAKSLFFKISFRFSLIAFNTFNNLVSILFFLLDFRSRVVLTEMNACLLVISFNGHGFQVYLLVEYWLVFC